MGKLKKCPVCGRDTIYPVGVHIQEVRSEHSTEFHRITVGFFKVTMVCFDSGSLCDYAIIREYLGKCGHRWVERERFYNGNALQEWKQIQEREADQ